MEPSNNHIQMPHDWSHPYANPGVVPPAAASHLSNEMPPRMCPPNFYLRSGGVAYSRHFSPHLGRFSTPPPTMQLHYRHPSMSGPSLHDRPFPPPNFELERHQFSFPRHQFRSPRLDLHTLRNVDHGFNYSFSPANPPQILEQIHQFVRPVINPDCIPVSDRDTIHSQWLINWQERVKQQFISRADNCKRQTLKLCVVQQEMQQMQNCLENLQELREQMAAIQLDASDDDWKSLEAVVNEKKKLFEKLSLKFETDEMKSKVNKLVEKRKRKRARSKRSRQNRMKILEAQQKEWKEKDQLIDNWQKELREKELRERKDKELRVEADAILSEVRQKLNDVSRMKELLINLHKLREARMNQGGARGQAPYVQTTQRFNDALEKLEMLLIRQECEYRLEEQTLCVMLEGEREVQRTPTTLNDGEELENRKRKLTEILFGSEPPTDIVMYEWLTRAEKSLEDLIAIRNDWDNFIDGDNPDASSVPLGWVVPPKQPSVQWQIYSQK